MTWNASENKPQLIVVVVVVRVFFSTRTPILWRNYAILWPTMRNATHFYPGSMRNVIRIKNWQWGSGKISPVDVATT